MLRIVSHELGGPLTVINIAVAGLLQSPPPSPDRIHENASVLKRAAEWMDRLLHDLLDIASLEAGRFTLSLMRETPRALVTQAVEMFEGAAHGRGVTLEGITAPDLPMLFVDPARVLQALGNLVTNALKAATTLHEKKPALDLSGLNEVIDKLTQSSDSAIQAEAKRTQEALSKTN